MALTKDILATFKAEKAREKVKERAAARYMRVRTLLDQADRLITEAQLPKQLKNKFAAKILRARRELDLGDCPSKVSEIVHEIVLILSKDVKAASKFLDLTLNALKKDLETLDRRKDGELLPRFSKALSLTQKQIRLPKIESSEVKNAFDSLPPREYKYDEVRKAADSGDSPTPKKLLVKEKREKNRKETPKENDPSPAAWYENESEEDRRRMELELSEECGTLDTLHFALRILNEMGRPDLTAEEVRELETTMKRTKKMLLNRRECQKLRGPLETLQFAMELPKGDRDPAFTNALQAVHKAVDAFEILNNLNAK